MKKIIGLLFLISTSSFAQQGYVCIADLSTGFSFNKSTKTWNTSNFNVRGSKYLLSKSSTGWEWKKFGESYGIPCSKDFNVHGYLSCSGFGEDINFNKKNLRYLLSYSIGYVNGGIAGTEGGDTPSMEIGKCSPM